MPIDASRTRRRFPARIMTDSEALLDDLHATLRTGAAADRRAIDKMLGRLGELAESLTHDGLDQHSESTRYFLADAVESFKSHSGEDEILASIRDHLAELAPLVSGRAAGVPPAPRRSSAKSTRRGNAARIGSQREGTKKAPKAIAQKSKPARGEGGTSALPRDGSRTKKPAARADRPPHADPPPAPLADELLLNEIEATVAPSREAGPVSDEIAVYAPTPGAEEVTGAAAIAFDAELLAGFCAEASEHLEQAEAHLLLLEKNPQLPESLDGLFRSFHTIKGAAGFLELTHIVSLAHEAENVLDLARNGRLALTGDTADLVLSSVDALKLRIARLSTEAGRSESAADAFAREQLVAQLAAVAAAASAAPDSNGLPAAFRRRSPAPVEIASPGPGEHAPAETLGPPSDARSPDAISKVADAAKESVKVDRDRLDRLIDLIGELVISESMVRQNLLAASVDASCARNLGQLDKITRHLQELSLSLRMVPVRATFQKMSRLVRDLGRKLDKQIELELSGEDTELDKTLVDQIGDPLMHMIRNSVDHGIEPTAEERTAAGKPACGHIALRAFHQGGNICIEIEDDGRGLHRDRILAKARERGLIPEDKTPPDDEILQLIFRPGFSTAARVTDVSGRGVGMDVVRRNVEAMRGRIDLRSTFGRGTCFTIRLPLTLAIIDGMVVRVAQERYIVPMPAIVELLRPRAGEVGTVAGRAEYFSLRSRQLPLLRLRRLLSNEASAGESQPDAAASSAPEEGIILVVEEGNRLVGLLVDEVLGQQQAVIKSLGSGLLDQPGVSGGAVMPDGRVGLILDVHGLLDLADVSV
jgi:two-component system chemotaxis sensor kinase CheA